MKQRILLVTTMYPNPLRPGTVVCQSFTREWKRMGYDVLVIHFRSIFPAIYTLAARLMPKLALRYVGDHVEMDRNKEVVEFCDNDGIPVYSIPIFKLFPHGKYSELVLSKKVDEITQILKIRSFRPDVIVGHFYNPQLEIVAKLKKIYPTSKTCVSLHEDGGCVKKLLGEKIFSIMEDIDTIGFRSVPIKNSFESIYGNSYNSLLCWSGTPDVFLNTPATSIRRFYDGPVHNFIYVGQTIRRKFPKQTIEGVHKAMGGNDFSLTYIGSLDLGYRETVEYINLNHLNNRVTFTGVIPKEDIIKYYDSSDCFILISKNEVFGLVYLEAMSRGCITIASRDEGMEGVIEHGVNGFLCEAGNANELAEIIRYINHLSAIEKQMISDKARERAVELSDYNVAKSYINKVINN